MSRGRSSLAEFPSPGIPIEDLHRNVMAVFRNYNLANPNPQILVGDIGPEFQAVLKAYLDAVLLHNPGRSQVDDLGRICDYMSHLEPDAPEGNQGPFTKHQEFQSCKELDAIDTSVMAIKQDWQVYIKLLVEAGNLGYSDLHHLHQQLRLYISLLDQARKRTEYIGESNVGSIRGNTTQRIYRVNNRKFRTRP